MGNLDVVENLKTLLDKLIITNAYLDNVEKELKRLEEITEKNASDWEDLYEKEFELCMEMNGLHSEIQRLAKKIETPETKFQVRRILQEANKIYKPLVVQIGF